jgi:DNA-directed RNA polymerase specialized sigma24 family protein
LKDDEIVLLEALRKLPSRPRAVIAFELADLDTATIAGILGVREATVRSHRRHGIKALRQLMIEGTDSRSQGRGGILDTEYS